MSDYIGCNLDALAERITARGIGKIINLNPPRVGRVYLLKEELFLSSKQFCESWAIAGPMAEMATSFCSCLIIIERNQARPVFSVSLSGFVGGGPHLIERDSLPLALNLVCEAAMSAYEEREGVSHEL